MQNGFNQNTPEHDLNQILTDMEQLWNSPEVPVDMDLALATSPSVLPIATYTPRINHKTHSQPSPIFKLTPQIKVGAMVAGSLAILIATGAATQQFFNNQEQKEQVKAEQQLRKVMYQNVQAKVAAFKQEVTQGKHFIVEQTKAIQYTTQTGDTVKKLAQKFHVTPNTIIKNNERQKLKAKGIAPGTKLTILPVDGISHPVAKHETIAEISKRYDVKVKDIIQTNQITNPQLIREKQSIIIPNATDLKLRPRKKTVKPKAKASLGKFMQRGNQTSRATGRRLSWPAAGTLTSNFGWRWFRMHNGIDIAGPVGTPIKAAKEGRIVYSGWMGGYGYAIDIDHGGGMRTRYAHNSSLMVRVGQHVRRGQHIAAMGSTGHSTGPHLHFEVHHNGRAVNPRSQF